jgi:ribonuclease HII
VFVAGVDEAGRGPLAGPVVAAAVILDPAQPIDGLRDSKKMTGRQREAAFETLQQRAIAIGVGLADSREIDELNILHATMLAMRRAVEALSCRPASVLVDGNRCPELLMPVDAIIGGDGTVPSISAASIIAKVTRDRIMLELHQRYPDYGFDRHKGYPTKAHRLALSIHGPTAEHRRSFAPVRDCPGVLRDT